MTKLVPVAYDGHTITFNDEAWINATEIAAQDWLTSLTNRHVK